MSKEENRLNFRMSPETAEKLEHWFKLDGCRSKNEFLERAVNYYADHLAAGTSTMLPRAVQSAIDGRLQLLEQRLSSLLFKQAVETRHGAEPFGGVRKSGRIGAAEAAGKERQ